MIKEDLDNLIKTSMKSGDQDRTNVLRAIKTKFMEVITAKNYDGTLDEIAVIRKMINDRENSARIYSKNYRDELATQELIEVSILKEFVPENPSDNNISVAISLLASEGIEITQKNMGLIMKRMKNIYPYADMKYIGNVIKEFINR